MPDRSDIGLIGMARQAAQHAYAPYSSFRVGAAVVTSDSTVVTGANVENASYPVSQCAEANAVAAAVSGGARSLTTVAVACVDAPDISGAYPCGRCRQIMAEFGVTRVLVATGDGPFAAHDFDQLLPFRFGP